MLYMVTFTINIPQMLAYIPYMDPMGYFFLSITRFLEVRARPAPKQRIQGFLSTIVKGGHLSHRFFWDLLQRGDTDTVVLDIQNAWCGFAMLCWSWILRMLVTIPIGSWPSS